MSHLRLIASTAFKENSVPDGTIDVYADQSTLALNPYSMTINFQKSPSSPTGLVPGAGNETVAVIRMSLEHAKILAMIIRRTLKQFELESLGDPINIPRSLLQQMNLTVEDW